MTPQDKIELKERISDRSLQFHLVNGEMIGIDLETLNEIIDSIPDSDIQSKIDKLKEDIDRLPDIRETITDSDIQNRIDKLKEWMREQINELHCDNIIIKTYGNEVNETLEQILNKMYELGL